MKKWFAITAWALPFGLVTLLLVARWGQATPPQKAAAPAKKAQAPAARKAPAKAAKKTAARPAPKPKAATGNKAHGLPPVMIGLYIFILAIFVGFELITKVPPLLHAPLMSGANAISGITVVGAIVCAGTGGLSSFAAILGFAALICAMVNVVGGFLVTDRMIQMYLKKK